jgi:hypothetical protein
MPFTDDGRLVADRLQQLWKRLLIAIESVAIAYKSVQVAVLARLNDSPTGTADGIGHVAAIETHPAVCDSIQVWCRDSRRIVRAERLLAVIIHKNEDNIRPLGRQSRRTEDDEQ